MIVLNKMNGVQFVEYCNYFIKDYAIEKEENYKITKNKAIKIASQELIDDLPEGINTKNNVLLCIDLENGTDRKLIGYLWYKINVKESSIFIYDFLIFPEYRSIGYGKKSIAILENNLRKEKIYQIKLRVAYTNKRALDLYLELGFDITGINMVKNIKENDES